MLQHPDRRLRAQRRSRIRQPRAGAHGAAAAVQFAADLPLFPQLPRSPAFRCGASSSTLQPRPPDARPTLLVFGGSQGAHAINQAVLDALPQLMAARPGHSHHPSDRRKRLRRGAGRVPEARGSRPRCSPFIDDMPGAFARADLLLCRSGASTVAEITAAGKPAIFVPCPPPPTIIRRRNAEALWRRRCARLLPQAELTADTPGS